MTVAKLSLKFLEFLRINAYRMNHQFREEILEILLEIVIEITSSLDSISIFDVQLFLC